MNLYLVITFKMWDLLNLNFWGKNIEKESKETQNKELSSIDFDQHIFVSDSVNKEKISHVVNYLKKQISLDTSLQFYLINKPILDERHSYNYEDDAVVILSPKQKVLFVDLKWNDDEFIEFVDNFLEDLWAISHEYNYMNVIGRVKSWKNKLTDTLNQSKLLKTDYNEFIIQEEDDGRRIKLIISILIGSINDIERVWIKPETILQKVKRNIILFDTEQTKFIYNQINKTVIKIQGLAGTWKTELLLHKLKEIYLKDDVKIFFTCHNKILAADLKERIPWFFDFMKVKKQINWNKNLRVANAWGSERDMNSGLYSYLCHFYNIPFFRYTKGVSYQEIFSHILDYIKKISKVSNFKKAFDYLLIDESQDFPDVFFEVCEFVTEKKIYVAWDIFQNIFDMELEQKTINIDFILNRCYRTDAKTLMFSHALWMGLFEKQKLNWLQDNEWKACWYNVKHEKDSDEIILTRSPIRRFDDIENNMPINIIPNTNVNNEILNIIESLQAEYKDIIPEDIAIIFIDDDNSVYSDIQKLELLINKRFKYKVNKSYETKARESGAIFISNANNVKGLEFPFVICVSSWLKNDKKQRNKLYTMLTRSFLKSYLIVKERTEDLSLNIKWLDRILDKWEIVTTIPSEEEIQNIKTTIKETWGESLEVLLDRYTTKYNLWQEAAINIRKIATNIFQERGFTDEEVEKFILDNKHLF